MIMVATELHVRSFWKFFPFIRHAVRSQIQARKAPGILHVWVGNGGWRIGYTLTAWKDRESMQQYRNSGAHKEAMKQIRRLSSRYKTLVWETPTIPAWKEAKMLLEKLPFTELDPPGKNSSAG